MSEGEGAEGTERAREKLASEEGGKLGLGSGSGGVRWKDLCAYGCNPDYGLKDHRTTGRGF